jgi:hypothetical protein
MATADPFWPNGVAPENEIRLGQSMCPVCGGYVISLRGFDRCSHCSYSFCESCEGGPADYYPAAED